MMIQEQPFNSTPVEITALAPQHAMNTTLPQSNDPNTFVSFMNTAPQPIGPIPPLAVVQPSGTPQTSILLSLDDVSGLKVVELKEEIIKRGLNRNDNKSALIKWLMDALDNNVPLVENMTNEIRDNLTGDTFHGGAHWTMIDQDGGVIEEENRVFIEAHRLLDPKVPHDNYWEDTNGVGPRKRNYTATADKEVFRKKSKMPEITMHGKVKMKEVKVVWKECMIN